MRNFAENLNFGKRVLPPLHEMGKKFKEVVKYVGKKLLHSEKKYTPENKLSTFQVDEWKRRLATAKCLIRPKKICLFAFRD